MDLNLLLFYSNLYKLFVITCSASCYVSCTSSLTTHSLRKVATGEKESLPAPDLVAYTLTQSFSHMSHQSGHGPLSPIAVDMVTGGPQYCDHLGPMP